MKVLFKQYLHDEWEETEHIKDQLLKAGVPADDIEGVMMAAGRPFYEVTLTCELDTETGKVILLEAKL